MVSDLCYVAEENLRPKTMDIGKSKCTMTIRRLITNSFSSIMKAPME